VHGQHPKTFIIADVVLHRRELPLGAKPAFMYRSVRPDSSHRRNRTNFA
jgi:hypothetical protein